MDEVIEMGLGKRRSKYGAFLDRRNIPQERIREITKLGRDTLTRVCNNPSYYPNGTSMRKLVDAARKLSGENVSADDFWPM
ncbi:transcriptional regulator [Paenibacillus chibensis]|uniref:transcriptional regulator n=2 Tax=Paenibacillus chibensis TaxID=59846 RepID=UPI000FD7D987|nr:transcriptional regulator [Paenibacillus chibensis]